MALNEVTLAESLKDAGYRTALFGKWHLGADRDHGPTKQGFGEFFGHRGGFIDNYNHFFLHGNGFHDLYDGTEEVFARDKFFPGMVVDRSLKFIEENRDRPFFLYLAFNTPHYPEQALAEDLARYKDLPMPRRSYAAFVTTTDRYIGQVLGKLESLGLDDNTIVVFMSDNGASKETNHIRVDNHSSGLPKGHRYGANGGGGNMGNWLGQKGSFLEGGIRVPAMISYPASLPQGEVRDQMVTVMDWYPTVMELCQLDPPEVELDGQSLLPVIRSATAKSPHKVLHFQWQRRWAVRRGNWKLLDGTRLVNLADEQPEAKNYAAEKPALVADLKQLHEAWAADVTPRP